MNLNGASAIVAGGASGLGEATVRRLHASGARVLIADLAADRGASLAKDLKDRIAFVECDVTDEQAGRAVEQSVELHGGLDILVNCAGIGGPRKILGKQGVHELEHYARIVQVNLVGTFNMLRLAAGAMASGEPDPGGERGVIVNTASTAAFEGQIGQCAYASSKGGIASLTLPAARELARHGIRVVTVAPGLFDTPMLARVPEPVRQSLEEQTPFPQRLGRPEEFAAMVQHIVENPMLNGAVIRLDGALRMSGR